MVAIEDYLRLRKILFLIVCLLNTHLLTAQEKGNVRTRAMLQSHNWQLRWEAFSQIKDSKSPEARKALIDLVNRENDVTFASYRSGIGVEDQYGEDYVSYKDDVTIIVGENFKQFHDPAALRVLLRSAYNPDSIFAKWLGEQGPDILPYTSEMMKSDLDVERFSAVAVVAHLMSAYDDGKVSLSSVKLVEAHNQLLLAAHHPHMYTRAIAAEYLGHVGWPSDMTLLQQMATADPGFESQLSIYPARDAALIAIAEMKTRQTSKAKQQTNP